jgi:hypothetical protein
MTKLLAFLLISLLYIGGNANAAPNPLSMVMVDDIPIYVPTVPRPFILDLQIPDANFKQCILDAANAAVPKWVYVDQITQLFCVSKGINSINGVQSLVNLQQLAIGNNNISDLTPLNGLTKTSLILGLAGAVPDSNPLYSTNIAAIKNMSKLKVLSVYSPTGSNRIQASAFSGGFSGLTKLTIYTLEMPGSQGSGFPCSFVTFILNWVQQTGITINFQNYPPVTVTPRANVPMCVDGL